MCRFMSSFSLAIRMAALLAILESNELSLNLAENSYQSILPSPLLSIYFKTSSISRDVIPKLSFLMALRNSTCVINPLPSSSKSLKISRSDLVDVAMMTLRRSITLFSH